MFALFDRDLVAFLEQAGCDVELVRLADHGVHGNSHGIMIERNNVEALAVLTRLGRGQVCPAKLDTRRPAAAECGVTRSRAE